MKGVEISWLRIKTKKILVDDRNNSSGLLYRAKMNEAISFCLENILAYFVLPFEIVSSGFIISLWCFFTCLRLQCTILIEYSSHENNPFNKVIFPLIVGSLIYEKLGEKAFGWPGKIGAFISITMQNIGGKRIYFAFTGWLKLSKMFSTKKALLAMSKQCKYRKIAAF